MADKYPTEVKTALEGNPRMRQLMMRFQRNTITREECYELYRWLMAVQQPGRAAPTDISFFVDWIMWALEARIERLNMEHRS